MLYGQQPDWQRLYVKGRCRAIGTAWTDEEDILISKARTDVEREDIIAKLRSDKTGVNHDFEKFATQPKKVEEKTVEIEKVEEIEIIIDENDKSDEQTINSTQLIEEKQENSTEISQKEVEINLDEQTIKQLKEIYVQKFGKNPFNGWDKETIIQKLLA